MNRSLAMTTALIGQRVCLRWWLSWEIVRGHFVRDQLTLPQIYDEFQARRQDAVGDSYLID